MGTKLYAGCCVAITAAAVSMAQPIQSDARMSAASSGALLHAHELSHNSTTTNSTTTTLASSSVIPAFVPHSLPVAEIADVAADIVLRSQAPQSEPTNQPDIRDIAFKWTDVNPEQLSKTSTVHSHLQDFNAILNPDGFHRGNWQVIRSDINSGSSKLNAKPFIVMIDPGHGGTDPGSKGHNGLLEKDLTLDIARRVRLFLTEFPDIVVELTRHHDHGLSRQSRVDAIKRSKADMVISLHFNHLPQTNVNLVESYYAGVQNIKQSLSAQNRGIKSELRRTAGSDADMDLGFTQGSIRLAKTLQQHIFSEVSFDNDHVQNAGVKEKTLFVLTQSFAPAALIEISCLSHAAEADRLASDEYRNRLAASIVDGIRNYHDSIQRFPLKSLGDLGA